MQLFVRGKHSKHGRGEDCSNYHGQQQGGMHLCINKITPKHSVEALATIIQLKHFGHIQCTSDSMEKIFVLGLTCSNK